MEIENYDDWYLEYLRRYDIALLEGFKFIPKNSECIDWFIKHYDLIYRDAMKFVEREKVQEKKLNDLKYYMFTFTLRPGSDATAARQYVRSIEGRKDTLSIFYLSYVEELTKNGVPHWHVCIGSTRSDQMKPSVFKHYIEKYGNIDKSKKITSERIGIDDYLQKENKPTILIENGVSRPVECI